MSDNEQTGGMPQPDPALKVLDRFVGSWTMRGRVLGSEEENIVGKATFQWLPGGFFLQQDIELDFAGMVQIASREIIRYDPETRSFPSTVYSNLSPAPLPYHWTIDGDQLTISVTYEPLDATFEGAFSPNGESFSGGWRPNPGADPAVNVSYDIAGTRLR